jgi:Protein of unknown function (DUF1302)
MGTQARKSSPQLRKRTLPVMLAVVAAAPTHAFEFKNEAGDITGNFDTTISVGASWRMQGRDPALIGIVNGGTSRSPNEDDGDLNYDKGDLYSTPLKMTLDFELKYKNYGLFARGSYFYDFTYSDQTVSPITGFGPAGRDRLGNDGELLDLFVYGNFDVGGRSLNARLGQQVLNWGESTFIPNGINIVNPVDVAKLRTPGAELREALLPQPMVWFAQEISERFTVEAFYQFKHRQVQLDPRGSYFSSNDFISDDGNQVFVGFARRNDQHGAAGVFPVNATAQAWAPRTGDRDPGDAGQYGVALRAFVPDWKNVELGLYYVNYHSRTPIVSATRGGLTTAATIVPGCTVVDVPRFGGVFAATGNAVTATTSACQFSAGRPATYFAEYPENIHLWGASFNVQGPAGIALQGEYSYRPNQPLQVASVELLLAALGLRNNLTGGDVAAFGVPYGAELSGFRRVKMHQVQATATKAFGPTLGANQFAVIGEVGYTQLGLPSDVLFNGPGIFLPAPGSSTATSNGSAQPNGEGYATKNSWGYRLLARMDFENAIGAASLSPRIAFAHDVRGVSPTFNHGAKAATVGIALNYRQNWVADLAYTMFWGGRTYSGTDPLAVPAGQSRDFASSANPLKDRDFLSISLSYSF